MDNQHSISGNWITVLCENRNRIIWIGKTRGGLNRFDLESNKVIHCEEKDGLPDEALYAILGDENGDLRIGSRITWFFPHREKSRIIQKN